MELKWLLIGVALGAAWGFFSHQSSGGGSMGNAGTSGTFGVNRAGGTGYGG